MIEFMCNGEIAEFEAEQKLKSGEWKIVANRKTRKKWRDRGADVRWIPELGEYVRVNR